MKKEPVVTISYETDKWIYGTTFFPDESVTIPFMKLKYIGSKEAKFVDGKWKPYTKYGKNNILGEKV